MSEEQKQSDQEVEGADESTQLADANPPLADTVPESTCKQSSSTALKVVMALTLIIALFGTAASYMVWMQQQKITASVDARINKKLQDSLRPLQSKQKKQLDAIESRLEQNRKTIQRTLQSQQSFQNHVQRKADDDVNLIEAESLLRLAGNRLNLSGDIETAILALHAAAGIITNYSQPEIIAVRQQIETELQSLQGVRLPDIPLYLDDIRILVNSSDSLPLISAGPKTLVEDKAVEAKTETGQGGWYEIWSKMLTELKPLLVIRRTNQVTPAMLGDEEERLVRVILKGRYELVRQAVLLKDDRLLKKSIQDIETWHRLYFDMDHADARPTVKLLATLKSIELTASIPPVGRALKQLREYRLKESGVNEQK